MTTKSILFRRGAFTLAAAAMLVAFAAHADTPQHEEGMHHKKGKGHNPPTFAEVDANSDGFIVQEELYQMHGKRMAARAAEGRKLKNTGKGPNFEKIDQDGDGKLTREEFAAHQAECRHARHSD